MSSQGTSFTLGLTYWPRRSAFGWWAAFDRSEVREELMQVASIGFDSVRFCLRWEDFQLAPHRLNSRSLRSLERALDTAAEARLKVVVTLFPVALGGALHLPRWVSHPDPLNELQQLARFGRPLVVQPSAAPPVIYDQGYHHNESHDLFRDPAIRDAQRYFINEAVGYFGTHPAITAWQLGEGLERVRKPDSADAVQDWYADLTEAIRAAHSGARVLGITSERGLTTSAGPRPEQLAEICDSAGVAADSPLLLPGQPSNKLDAVDFLYALVATLAGRPMVITGLGQPTAPNNQSGWINDTAYGRETQVYRASEEEQAEFISRALQRLKQAGSPGVWLAAYADYPTEVWRMPPLDNAIRERTLGVVSVDGREKPVAKSIRAFATALRAQTEQNEAQATSPTIDMDPERYWRDPRRELVRLWREWADA